MFVEVGYGIFSNSLGLLTDGAHMLLDCSAVVIGLYSNYLSTKEENKDYNFGYKRSEVLGTFINSVFLVFIAIYIVFESIEIFLQPKEIFSKHLLVVSTIGLLVNLIGVFALHDVHLHSHHNHKETKCSHEKEHEKDIEAAHSNEHKHTHSGT